MRTGALALAAGLLVTAAVAGCIVFVTNDMRWVLAIGSATLLLAAWWVGSRRRGGGVSFLLLVGPLLLLFGGMVVPELPVLWPHLTFWSGFTLIGWLGFRSKRSAAVALAALGAETAVSLWYGLAYVPGQISQMLSHYRDDPAPAFTLDRLDGSPYAVESLEGKVVVLDFFATWCAPCIAELPELEEVWRHFEADDGVEILVVANDSGGDTPGAIRDFVEARGLELEFVYDPDGVAHAAFGFAGLPGLVVLDRHGRIRLTREGYNAAETGFRENLVGLVESLL